MFDAFLKYHRIPEPELMEDYFQVHAYKEADFDAPHTLLVESLVARLPEGFVPKRVLDVGAGPGDVSRRLAKLFPQAHFTLLDGSQEMLKCNQSLWPWKTTPDVHFEHKRIQDFCPEEPFDLIFSNSVLHHMHDPYQFWACLQRSLCEFSFVFVSDLLRPDSIPKAKHLVELYASQEPEVLKKDFFASLQAAFRIEEVERMLNVIRWNDRIKVEMVSDRHWIAYGVWT